VIHEAERVGKGGHLSLRELTAVARAEDLPGSRREHLDECDQCRREVEELGAFNPLGPVSILMERPDWKRRRAHRALIRALSGTIVVLVTALVLSASAYRSRRADWERALHMADQRAGALEAELLGIEAPGPAVSAGTDSLFRRLFVREGPDGMVLTVGDREVRIGQPAEDGCSDATVLRMVDAIKKSPSTAPLSLLKFDRPPNPRTVKTALCAANALQFDPSIVLRAAHAEPTTAK